MSYEEQQWKDHSSQFPGSAARFQHIEKGIKGEEEARIADVIAAEEVSVGKTENRPVLTNKYGLKRFRAFAGDALFSLVPIVCVGDSITYGQGGNNNTGAPENEPDAKEGWVGQLRTMLGASPQSASKNPGEGFWFADDPRITAEGGPVSNNWACTPLRHGYRLIKNTQKLKLTVPAGVTSIGVIQANMPKSFNEAGSKLADVTGAYKIGAGAETPLSALTNTGLPLEQSISVTEGETFTIFGPSTAQTYVTGVVMKGGTTGFLVHRMGQPGYVSGDLLGGQGEGKLLQSASTENQTYAARATYRWSSAGLVILSFGTNDQSFQTSGGTASQGKVTLGKYTEWMRQYASQAVEDGWCVLILGEPRSPEPGTPSTLNEYWAAMKVFAAGSEHISFVDTGELWGSHAAAEALGLTVANTVHPNRKGHGDMARMVYRAILGNAPSGVAEVTPA